MTTPIKRKESLKPLSREHHHGLLLCWKIKQGKQRNVEAGRILNYLIWFWINHLKAHFETEENHIFPILGNGHQLVKRALEEHRTLRRLFEGGTDLQDRINRIELELDKHIRFEERILFKEIQNKASEEQLRQIQPLMTDKHFLDKLDDPFWE